MQSVAANELLNVWEQGRRQFPFQRALLLLAAANPGVLPETLADLSIGQRDSQLLTLRSWTFGPRIASIAHCPECSTRVELDFDVEEIRAPIPATLMVTLSHAGYSLELRLPNSRDIAAVIGAGTSALFQRCVIEARCNGFVCTAESLPDAVVQAATNEIARADQQADVQLALECPQCANTWQVPFNIVSFFWSEIEAWAGRMFQEIHLIARHYGWHEADILALSPLRRRIYLEMLGA